MPGRVLRDRPCTARSPKLSTTYGLTLRGISLFGPNGGDGKTSAVSVDGMPSDTFDQDVAGLSTWDVARIDVHRSRVPTAVEPQALAGAVVVRTRDPTEARDLRGRTMRASNESRSPAACLLSGLGA